MLDEFEADLAGKIREIEDASQRARARQEATLAAGAAFEELTGLDKLVPIDPRPGTVPPV